MDLRNRGKGRESNWVRDDGAPIFDGPAPVVRIVGYYDRATGVLVGTCPHHLAVGTSLMEMGQEIAVRVLDGYPPDTLPECDALFSSGLTKGQRVLK